MLSPRTAVVDAVRVVVTSQPDASVTHVSELVDVHTPQVQVAVLLFVIDGELPQVHLHFQELTRLKWIKSLQAYD